MATLTISWDNSAVLASSSATGQRALKRKKRLAGAYVSTGFSPANDLAKSVNTTDATVDSNNVYQFKVCAICGSTLVENNNGPIEGISFACIVPTRTVSGNSVTLKIDVTGTDIKAARFIVKKVSDNSLVSSITAARAGDECQAYIPGLTYSTNYYVEIILIAEVAGVDVMSDQPGYIEAVCGGNTTGYQFSTGAQPSCPAPTNLVITLTAP